MHRAQHPDDRVQPHRIRNQIAIRRHQVIRPRVQPRLDRHARRCTHRPPQLWRQIQVADLDAFRLHHHRAPRIEPRQRQCQRAFKRLL